MKRSLFVWSRRGQSYATTMEEAAGAAYRRRSLRCRLDIATIVCCTMPESRGIALQFFVRFRTNEQNSVNRAVLDLSQFRGV